MMISNCTTTALALSSIFNPICLTNNSLDFGAQKFLSTNDVADSYIDNNRIFQLINSDYPTFKVCSKFSNLTSYCQDILPGQSISFEAKQSGELQKYGNPIAAICIDSDSLHDCSQKIVTQNKTVHIDDLEYQDGLCRTRLHNDRSRPQRTELSGGWGLNAKCADMEGMGAGGNVDIRISQCITSMWKNIKSWNISNVDYSRVDLHPISSAYGTSFYAPIEPGDSAQFRVIPDSDTERGTVVFEREHSSLSDICIDHPYCFQGEPLIETPGQKVLNAENIVFRKENGCQVKMLNPAISQGVKNQTTDMVEGLSEKNKDCANINTFTEYYWASDTYAVSSEISRCFEQIV